ncbi:MAG: hypothetical protein FIA92_14500 [Chloroflexi bacterium]|nr:hypothetical protein [Chloroflexota bacterium]
MRRFVPIAAVLGLLLSLSAGLAVMAHEGEEGIEVEPSSVTAGDTVVLAGSGLEPNAERVLLLAGGSLIVAFGTVTTDAEGMFSLELTIPNHLPSGNYELRAIGDETLTTPLGVTAAAGGVGATPAPNDAGEAVVARDRSPLELVLILALVALATVVGVWLVWRAERFRGAQTA